MFLIPEVRYELRDGDVLKFGNICFEYKFDLNYVSNFPFLVTFNFLLTK